MMNKSAKSLHFIISIMLMFLFSSCKLDPGNRSGSKALGGSSSGSATKFGKWNENNLPLYISISSNFTSTERSFINSAISQWENAHVDGKNLSTINSSPINHKDLGSSGNYLLDNSIEVHKINNSWMPADALAITVFDGYVINPGTSNEYIEIDNADILINDYDFDFSLTPEYWKYDLPSVVAHEAGHLLGLDHIEESQGSSIMNPYLEDAMVKRSITSLDSSNINNLYRNNSLALTNALQNALSSQSEDRRGNYVQGMIKLRANGNCSVTMNGKEYFLHQK